MWSRSVRFRHGMKKKTGQKNPDANVYRAGTIIKTNKQTLFFATYDAVIFTFPLLFYALFLSVFMVDFTKVGYIYIFTKLFSHYFLSRQSGWV
jgi:hypothetical protein